MSIMFLRSPGRMYVKPLSTLAPGSPARSVAQCCRTTSPRWGFRSSAHRPWRDVRWNRRPGDARCAADSRRRPCDSRRRGRALDAGPDRPSVWRGARRSADVRIGIRSYAGRGGMRVCRSGRRRLPRRSERDVPLSFVSRRGETRGNFRPAPAVYLTAWVSLLVH